MRLESFGLTDVGKLRNHNEDSFAIDEKTNLYIVADGMGGHAAGEVASRTAVSMIEDFANRILNGHDVPWPESIDAAEDLEESILKAAIHIANLRICRLSNEVAGYNGMGTTVSAIMVEEGKGHIAHVGDSRIYLLRNGNLSLLTTDHSWIQEQLDRNMLSAEEAREHRWRNVITRALGNRPDLEIDTLEHELVVGDIYLLCTDGLTNMVVDDEIAALLLEMGDDLKGTAATLVDMANEAGGEDNITLVLLNILP